MRSGRGSLEKERTQLESGRGLLRSGHRILKKRTTQLKKKWCNLLTHGRGRLTGRTYPKNGGSLLESGRSDGKWEEIIEKKFSLVSTKTQQYFDEIVFIC